MHRRTFLLSSTATVVSCTRQTESRRVRLVVAGAPATLAYLPHAIAEQLGFYRQQDLMVAVNAVAGGTKGVQALLGGSADIVAGFYDHSIRIAAQGQAVRSFVTLTRLPGTVVITSPKSAKKITNIGELKHTIIGVSDIGAQAHLVLNYLLTQHGLKPSDVTVIATGFQQATVAALERERLDAASTFDPAVTQLRRRYPSVRILADGRTNEGVHKMFGVDFYPGSVLYAKTDWLSKNAGVARRLARAMQAALHWIHEHTPEEVMGIVPSSYFGEDPTAYREALVHSLDMYSDTGAMPEGGPEAVRTTLAASLDSVRTTKIDLSKTYTNDFLQLR